VNAKEKEWIETKREERKEGPGQGGEGEGEREREREKGVSKRGGLRPGALTDALAVGLDRDAIQRRLPALLRGGDLWEPLGERVTLRREVLARWIGAAKVSEQSTPKNWESFLCEWTEEAPDGVRVSGDLLSGLAFLADSGETEGGAGGEAAGALVGGKRRRSQVLLCPLDRDNLPHALPARFARLFSLKPSWTCAALTPFLADAVVPGSTVDQILLKYTRSAPGPGGERLYMAK
jgi:hypothetical protein